MLAPAMVANLWTIAASGVVSLMSAIVVIRTAQIKTGPAADEALTNRIKAVDERMEAERVRLEGRIEDLEAQVGRLEIVLLRERAWGDEAGIAASRQGVKLPPRPQFSHAV